MFMPSRSSAVAIGIVLAVSFLSLLDTTERVSRKVWELACCSGCEDAMAVGIAMHAAIAHRFLTEPLSR
jgi:hypothetical protein